MGKLLSTWNQCLTSPKRWPAICNEKCALKLTLLIPAALFALGITAGAFAQSHPPPDQQLARDGFGSPAQVDQPTNSAPVSSQVLPQVASHLVIRPGTYLTVRVNQWLSSDRNQQGDAFFANLAAPLVVDGVVVAQRGQTVAGRVSEAVKAGRAKGTSRLGLQLTELTLADGRQIPIETQLVNRNGSTALGRDAGAVGTTTALGAIIGAGADRGSGAAIGAGAGAAAGLIGVLMTRGNATRVSPETALTFRLEIPVDIDTSRGLQAFRNVDPRDYERAEPARRNAYDDAPPPPRPWYGPVYGPGIYGPGYGPGWGPGLAVYIGSGHRGRGYYRGRRW